MFDRLEEAVDLSLVLEVEPFDLNLESTKSARVCPTTQDCGRSRASWFPFHSWGLKTRDCGPSLVFARPKTQDCGRSLASCFPSFLSSPCLMIRARSQPESSPVAREVVSDPKWR